MMHEDHGQDRRRGEYSDRLQRVEVAVAVLESTTSDIRRELGGLRDDVKSAKNYTIVTLIGGAAAVLWQVFTHPHGF